MLIEGPPNPRVTGEGHTPGDSAWAQASG
jgi:hypothetical protein